eukprot:713096-Pyramimonas_sp.AAC.1
MDHLELQDNKTGPTTRGSRQQSVSSAMQRPLSNTVRRGAEWLASATSRCLLLDRKEPLAKRRATPICSKLGY